MNEQSGTKQPADLQLTEALTLLGINAADAALYVRLRRVALTMMLGSDAIGQQLGESLSDVAEAWLTDLYSGDAAGEDRKILLGYLRQYDGLPGSTVAEG